MKLTNGILINELQKPKRTAKSLDELCGQITETLCGDLNACGHETIREYLTLTIKDYIANRMTPFTLKDAKNTEIYEHLIGKISENGDNAYQALEQVLVSYVDHSLASIKPEMDEDQAVWEHRAHIFATITILKNKGFDEAVANLADALGYSPKELLLILEKIVCLKNRETR